MTRCPSSLEHPRACRWLVRRVCGSRRFSRRPCPRQQLHALLETYQRDQDRDEVVRLTLRWIRDVRSDMRHEELDLLNRALLRDDPISIDMEAG